MKKLIRYSILIIAFLANSKAKAQSTINGSSTNPQNPVNTDFLPWANQHVGTGITWNPFLNTFNWMPVGSNNTVTDYIPIPYNTGYNIAGISLSGNILAMKNPFNTGLDIGLSNYAYYLYSDPNGNNIDVRERDFRWEDGWELLWVNLGTTPDGEQINTPHANGPFMNAQLPNPDQTPYFVLYNRYKGIIRLFANVWFNNTVSGRFQKVMPTLKFESNNVNGMLRHASSYDLALDEHTNISNIIGPSSQPTATDKWLMSDYQIGFDPCICNRNIAKLQFVFEAMNEMKINIISRSITINEKIEDENYLSDDFLNLTDALGTGSKPGSRIYKKMGSMLDSYKSALLKYESDLADYNSIDGLLKRGLIDILKDGIAATGSIVGSGVASSIFTNDPMKQFILRNKARVGLFSGGLIDLDEEDGANFAKSVVSGTKSIIASGFDFLSTQIDVPDEPIRPSPPSAAYTESSYTGQITHDDSYSTNALLVPGALPNAYPDGNNNPSNPGADKLNYPAYNEVLGLFALLETPKVYVKSKALNPSRTFFRTGARFYAANNTPGNRTHYTNFQIKLKDALKYRFNHSVDFNFDKTKLYYSFRIKIKNKFPTGNGIPSSIQDAAFLGSTSFIHGQSIKEQAKYNFETFKIDNNNKLVVVTTPFCDVKNMLNEPISITNSLEVNLEIAADVFNEKDPADFPSEFTISLSDFCEIEKIELKLMADMYFISKGSKNQELNTLQTFTYLIYQKEENDNQIPVENDNSIGNITFLKANASLINHISGTTIFENVAISPSNLSNYPFSYQSGNDLFIKVEDAIIKDNVTIASGYTLHIQFLGGVVIPAEATINPEIIIEHINPETIYGQPLIYEATNAEVASFCSQSNNLYQANSLSKTAQINFDKNRISQNSSVNLSLTLFPNPSTNHTKIQYTLLNVSKVSIHVYDVSGNLVSTMKDETSQFQGKHDAQINTSNLASGIYILTLSTSDGYSETKKLVVAH